MPYLEPKGRGVTGICVSLGDMEETDVLRAECD